MNFRNPKYYILPAILLGLIILATLKAEFNWIKNQFSTPSIDFRRFKLPPYTDTICSGERLRFTIVGTECDHVIWLFDENEDNFRNSNIEVDYAFAYDENQAPGISITHRVDAFCRKGDTYKPAMKRVTVFNRMVAGQLNERQNKLKVIVAPAIKDFRPKKITITDNTRGELLESDNLSFYLNSENVDRKKSTTIFDLSLTPLGTKTLVENSKSAEIWLRYEFTNDADENIIFFQRIKNLIQHN
jgi:hypothetical protein